MARGAQDDLLKRRWVRRAFISTSRARGISIRAAEAPRKALSAERKDFFGHGYVAGQKTNPCAKQPFCDPVHVGGETNKPLDRAEGFLRTLSMHALELSC